MFFDDEVISRESSNNNNDGCTNCATNSDSVELDSVYSRDLTATSDGDSDTAKNISNTTNRNKNIPTNTHTI